MYTTRQRAWCNKYDSQHMCIAVATVCLLLLLLLLRLKTYVQQRECLRVAGYLRKNKKCGVFHVSPTRLGEAESDPLFFIAKSATLNAPSTATVLGRDPDIRRNVPTPPWLSPKPKARKRTLSRRRAQHACKTKCISYTSKYIHNKCMPKPSCSRHVGFVFFHECLTGRR